MNRLQIFKPGRHTAMNGKVINFTPALLKATADAYDPELHEAPLVVGHPKTDAPAYGWTKSIAYAGGVLVAEPHQVEPQFAELVNAGRFKKLSATFYEPDAPANPVPGIYYLKHIGFLGSTAPAVKGLRSAAFSENEQGVIEFGDQSSSTLASLFSSFRELIIGQFGTETADVVAPGDSIAAIKARDAAAHSSSYSETDMETTEARATREANEAKLKADQETLAKDRAALEAKTAEFAERDLKIKAQEAAQRRIGIAGTVDRLVAEGKVLPVHKVGLVAFMAGVDEKAGTVEFGEGENKSTKLAVDWLVEYLDAQPKFVEFSELGKKGVEGVDTTDANAIAKAAVEFQESEKKAGRAISVTQAVGQITRGGKLARSVLEFQESEEKAGRSVSFAQAITQVAQAGK